MNNGIVPFTQKGKRYIKWEETLIPRNLQKNKYWENGENTEKVREFCLSEESEDPVEKSGKFVSQKMGTML